MASQLLEIDNATIDLDRIVYVSDNGHIAMDVHMVYQQVDPSMIKRIIESWGAWKAYKFERTLEAMRG